MDALVQILKSAYWLAAEVAVKTYATLSNKMIRSFLTDKRSLHYKITHRKCLHVPMRICKPEK